MWCVSSGMMTRKTGRRRHSGGTTCPCCLTSGGQQEVTARTLIARRTASSLRGGCRAWTHSETNIRKHIHTECTVIEPFSCAAIQLSQVYRCGWTLSTWMDFVDEPKYLPSFVHFVRVLLHIKATFLKTLVFVCLVALFLNSTTSALMSFGG